MAEYSINLQATGPKLLIENISRMLTGNTWIGDRFHFWDAQEDLDNIVWDWTLINP
jgi:hypothetical protein